MIIIAEDNQYIRDLIVSELEPLGTKLVPAVDGRDAYEKYTNSNANVLVTDFEMPRGNGIWLLSELKKQDLGKKCVFVTANASTITSQLIELGATAVFDKPWQSKNLLTLLKKLLAVDTPLFPRKETRIPARVPVKLIANKNIMISSHDISLGGLRINVPSEFTAAFHIDQTILLDLPMVYENGRLGSYRVSANICWQKYSERHENIYGMRFNAQESASTNHNTVVNGILTNLSLFEEERVIQRVSATQR